MVTVTVSGHGSYVVPTEKVQELLSWLAANQGSRLQETRPANIQFPGKDLLNG